jgi:hypothetical protein
MRHQVMHHPRLMDNRLVLDFGTHIIGRYLELMPPRPPMVLPVLTAGSAIERVQQLVRPVNSEWLEKCARKDLTKGVGWFTHR